MNTTTIVRGGHRTAQVARDVLSLFKLRIGVLIMVTALVGLAVTPGAALGPGQVLVLALSVLVASAAAGAFNQYVEHESDRLMARTRRRAFVTGALPHHPAWLALIAALLAGAVAAAWFTLNAAAAVYVFLGAFFYAVVYTVWLKRRSAWNIVIGGLAGSFAVLAGGAAADPALGPLPLLLALVLFLWTPPHFWSLAIANSADYEAAGVPMLPVVVGAQRAARIVFYSTVALVAASLLPLAFGAGPVYAIGAAGGGAHFLRKSWLLARAPARATAMGSFFASLVQLSALLVAATIDGLLR
ncbi:protoheme IX farnesyltransferase [Ramlibacter sp. RBP-2]|uniref:Protoheme IX farnesyltransferase n=1 Tax=Ramlibacter lithotrophicus TaxID=2606681 RepID=A0A7X6I4V8_9BURK|nr:heme o synthase [Ramlibacter lithotrophicus]NKE64449.1 protoheme IX farnesyltransferase [Ramlibacter lithotrophicus]